jgi:RimJ/RimL family protein N-acetyltransferase
MECTLRRTEDVDEVKELHQLAFRADHWPGDDHIFWIAKNPKGKPLGFCSAQYWPEHRGVYLSRAAVTLEARGSGLQRRMIRTRLNWSKRETDAVGVWTFAHIRNYESIVNLLKCGFKFDPREHDPKYFAMYLKFANHPDFVLENFAKRVF